MCTHCEEERRAVVVLATISGDVKAVSMGADLGDIGSMVVGQSIWMDVVRILTGVAEREWCGMRTHCEEERRAVVVLATISGDVMAMSSGADLGDIGSMGEGQSIWMDAVRILTGVTE